MIKFFRLSFLLRIGGIAMGLISIFGGFVMFQVGREPYRHYVSALIMVSGGILWLMSSMISKYKLTGKNIILFLVFLVSGLAIGLFDKSIQPGGEGACFWGYGYPGYWLRLRCAGAKIGGPWHIDPASFIADVVFWSGIGLIFFFIWKTFKLNKISSTIEK